MTDTKYTRVTLGKAMADALEKNEQTVYYGRGSSRADSDRERAVQEAGSFQDWLEQNHHWMHDNSWELKKEAIKEVLEQFDDELHEVHKNKYPDEDFDEFVEEIKDTFFEDVYPLIDENLGELFNYEKKVVVVMHSNYDCINSHFYNMQCGGYEYEESYFGDMLDMLGINPAAFKKAYPDYCVEGAEFPDKPTRVPKVTLESFAEELENSSCGACLLTIAFNVHAWDYYSQEHDEQMLQKLVNKALNRLPNEEKVEMGLYSSFQGGGSTMEVVRTDSPWTIEVREDFDEDYNAHWSLSSGGYAYDEVFG